MARLIALALPVAGAVVLAACRTAQPCESGDACPKGSVCQLDGTCAPLQSSSAWRFAHTQRLFALDWATSGRGGSRAAMVPEDQLPIGGRRDRVAHLDFGPLPHGGQVVRAVLALRPYPGWSGVDQPWRIAVHESRPASAFRRRLPPHRRYAPPTSVVRMRPGIGRPLYVDVTPLVAEAVRDGHQRVSLAVVAVGRGVPQIPFASPRAVDPDLRPRLDLVLR